MKGLYENLANKAASIIGFEQTEIENGDIALRTLFKNSFYGGEPLRNYLNYRYFDQKSENFLLTNNAAGFLLEISPLVGVDERITKSLNIFFAKELPKGGFLQFFLMASSDISSFMEFWKQARINPHPILNRITDSRIEYLKKQAANFSSSGKKLPRNFRMYVSYSKICNTQNASALSELSDFRSKLTDRLNSLQLNPSTCSTPELVNLCREFFELNPDKETDFNIVNKLDTVNNQCLQHGNYYHSQKKAFVNIDKGVAHRAYNFSKTPDFWSLAQNIELLGSEQGSPIPARFCLSLSITNDFKTDKGLIARGKRTIESAEKPYSRHDKALIEEAGQWRDIIHSLATATEAPLSESFCMFLSAKTEDIDKAEAEVTTMLSNHSWEACPIDYYHLEAILGAMPMHAANFWAELKAHKLVQTSLSSEVVSKLPIHAEWYGVPLSGIPLIGRRGQIFSWNPYHRLASGNFNVNVIGPTGVGKSVFLQDLTNAMLSQNTRTFILDIGQSYATLGGLLSGEIIQFGALSTFTINPFAGLVAGMQDNDFNQIVICAKELLSIMCGAAGEFELAILEEAIKDAVTQNNYNLDLTKFVQFLKDSEHELLNRFSKAMFSYTPSGVYGKYFSGSNQAKFDKQITIFEFEHVRDQPKLIAIILQTLLMQITSQFLTGDRSKKFMIIVDEAWRLLDFCSGFLAALARNLRRYGGSLVVCTQVFEDLQSGYNEENTNHRKAIFENSAWKVNLKPGSFSGYEKHSEFKHKIPMLQSISFERGEYSEMLLSTAGTDVVGRLILDPYSEAIYSTEQEDFTFLGKKEKEGVPIDIAVDQLIEFKKRKK